MEQSWLDQLIKDAERAADAAVRLMKLKVDALLARLSEARGANGDQAREAAYNNLQNELAPVLQALEPITLYDLQSSWVMHRGFRQSRSRSIGFWALSVLLLILVGYLTSLYDRAANLAQMMDASHHARLAEQAMKLFYVAREHRDEITEARASMQQALASETFFRELGDLQEAQASASSIVTDAQRLSLEIQFWSRRSYDLCRLARRMVGIVHLELDCIDPALEDIPALQRKFASQRGYSNVPPEDLATKFPQSLATKISAPDTSAKSATDAASGVLKASGQLGTDDLASVYELLDHADTFFQHIGLTEINTRASSPLNAVYIRPIKTALNALRVWFIPAAYGSLGAAIFFTRRFLNPTLPNPDALRVIYRILFGGFAGIVFAWFWTPFQVNGSTLPLSSLSSFAIAFLAGYSTDVLFEVLDRLVEAVSAQIRRSSSQSAPK